MKTSILLQIPNAKPTIGDDGWVQLAPFGDFHGVAFVAGQPRAAVQIVDKDTAAAIVNSVKSFTGRASRFFRSIPIYDGHPDVPALADVYVDRASKGTIADIQTRDDGIFIRPALTEAGASLVNGDTKLGLSAYVDADIVSDDGTTIVARWSRLNSVGITDSPNLPVQMMNSRHLPGSDNTPLMNQNAIIAALVVAGVQIANSADEAAVIQSIRGLADSRNSAVALANDRQSQIACITAERDALKTQLANAETQLANAEADRIKEILDERVQSGAIPESDRGIWISRLKANLANEIAGLKAIKTKIKTTSSVANGGSRRPVVDPGTPEEYAEHVRTTIASGKTAAEAVRTAIATLPNSYAAWRDAGCPRIDGV